MNQAVTPLIFGYPGKNDESDPGKVRPGELGTCFRGDGKLLVGPLEPLLKGAVDGPARSLFAGGGPGAADPAPEAALLQ
eukprot:1860780-Alexandrium_andersonii.AAC.1